MSSVLRPVRKHKKGRTLGSVEIIRREDYADRELDAKVELIRSLVPLGLMHVEEVLDAEVTALAGERYARKDASMGGRRHGSNPGPVGLAGQRVPMSPALETLHRELEDRNQSAAGSLAEGLDETLTLHRLGLYGVLGRSLKTTNGPSMRSSKNAVRRSITGRTRANATAGWRPRSWTSNRACGR